MQNKNVDLYLKNGKHNFQKSEERREYLKKLRIVGKQKASARIVRPEEYETILRALSNVLP